MKYIKSYESHEISEMKENHKAEFKDYVIYKHGDNLLVYKIAHEGYWSTKIEQLYKYTKNILSVNKLYDNMYTDVLKHNIVYQSDSLQDCLEILPSLSNAEKYNL